MNKKKYPAPDGDLIIIRLNGDETVASILDCDFGIGCTGPHPAAPRERR